MRVGESHATSADGTRIWWRSAGAGAPAVLLADGISCTGYIWRHLFPALAARRRVLHFNYRGHGRSARPRDLSRVTIADCVDDLVSVLDAAGEREAVLVGHSMGVQVCLEAHRRHPERVRALVLACGAPARALDHIHGTALLATALPYVERAVRTAPALSRAVFHRLLASELVVQVGLAFEVNRKRLPRADLEQYLSDAANVDLEVYVGMLASAAVHDARDHLPRVNVPTLVVAGAEDRWTPFALSEAMHEAIPGSELLRLPAGTHTGILEYPRTTAERVEAFLATRVRNAVRRA